MWQCVEGMRIRQYKHDGQHKRQYLINEKPVGEATFKRRYVAQLEAENQQLHEKLATIYDLL
ncbi:hypothetical protein PG2006B_0205 [Bifidobacterium animalis subsp. animalis]|nr:hypothetical protein PG2006B_0205 [Bifidobacterium animalis subsp. animalis]